LVKSTKCQLCIESIKNLNTSTVGSEADLLNNKTRGCLTHPDRNLYLILKHLETCFSKHATSCDVFEDTYNEFFSLNIGLKFPCLEHQADILTNIFSYYITMRMRQYSYLVNQNSTKLSKTKKKLSKLVKT